MNVIKENVVTHTESVVQVEILEQRIYDAFASYLIANAAGKRSVIAGAAALYKYALSLGFTGERLAIEDNTKSLAVVLLGERKPGRKKTEVVGQSRLTTLEASHKDAWVRESVNPKQFGQFINNSLNALRVLVSVGGKPNDDGSWAIPATAFLPHGYELANKRKSSSFYDGDKPRVINFGANSSRETVVEVVRLRKDKSVEDSQSIAFTFSTLLRSIEHNNKWLKSAPNHEQIEDQSASAGEPKSKPEQTNKGKTEQSSEPEQATPITPPTIPAKAVQSAQTFEQAQTVLARVRKSDTDFGSTIDYILSIVEAPDADTDELEFLKALQVVLNTRFAG